MTTAILVIGALIGIYFGYRLFCTGPTGAARRIGGAALAIIGVVALVGCAEHRWQPRESAARRTPVTKALRFLRQERPETHRPGHGKVAVEQFI